MAERFISIELVSVGTSYANYLKLSDVKEVIKDILKLQPHELEGIQKNGKRFEFGIKYGKTFLDKNLHAFLNKKYTLRNSKVIELNPASEDVSIVRVSKAPMYWSENKVERILDWYGNVKKIEKDFWRSGYDDAEDEFDGIWNGSYRIIMVVDRPIPSTLIVDKHKFEIFYTGQDKTCFKCGRAHMISECKASWSNIVNKFDLSEFPPIKKDPPAPPLPPLAPLPPPPPPMPPKPARLPRIRIKKMEKKSETLVEETLESVIEVPEVIVSVPKEQDQVIVNEEQTEFPKEQVIVNEDQVLVNEANEEMEVSKESSSLGKKQVRIAVHHAQHSQVTGAIAPIINMGEDETDTANEGEDLLTPGQGVVKSHGASSTQNWIEEMDSQDSTAFWTVIDDNVKRKDKPSSDEEGDGNTLKMGTGSFVNSFYSKSAQRSKRQNVDGTANLDTQFEDASNAEL